MDEFTSPDPSPPPDPQDLVDHLVRLLVVSLGATREDFEAKGSFLSEARIEETLQLCARFLNESQVALYAHKQSIESIETNGINGDHDLNSRFTFKISFNSSTSPTTVSTVVILKGSHPIDNTLPLSDQLQIVHFPRNQLPFQALHSILHWGVAPYFDAATKSDQSATNGYQKGDVEHRTGIPSAKKKLAELELSLLQLQQNAEIPELSLPLHPVVMNALSLAIEREIKPSLDLVPKSILGDSAFLNNIQSLVNAWIKSIQTITKTSRDPGTGSATQEINFWLAMETALEDIEAQLRSDGISLTMEILKNAKRFQATVSFTADTGLKEAMELVQRYNQLMRDFPLDELLSAPSLEKILDAVDLIFMHMNKKLRVSPYPVKRALPLVEAISGDLDARLHSLLNGRALMQMPFEEFEQKMSRANAIWKAWEENIQEFTNVARDVLRRRNERFIPIKIAPRHAETQERMKYIATFRTNHENLQRTIRNVLGPDAMTADESRSAGEAGVISEIGEVDAVEEVSEAYLALKDVDVLDVSAEGTRTWERAETLYNERTSRVENSIIARLRDRLATAKTANEMFRVFSKFNALFIRPKIRGAISEYQTQLIENVKQDITALHERFKQQYGHSQAHAMAQLHDLPPVSGAIIWARQIERQLDAYMKKVEDVLGTQWHLHSEGQKLRDDGTNFRRKLDTKPVFDSWVHDVTKRNVSISGRLFGINRNRATGNILELTVNFDAQIISLFKEVRNLLWLNYSVPHAIVNLSKAAKRVYPFAVSLMESVRTFIQTVQAVSAMADVTVLLSGYTLDAQKFIAKGMPLKWESFANVYDLHTRQAHETSGTSEMQVSAAPRDDSLHAQFIKDFASSVTTLQSKAATLTSIHETIQKAMSQLHSCSYQHENFQRELAKIQASVDQLSLESYSNLRHWVSKTNYKIQTVLLERLEQALSVWISTFEDAAAFERTNGKLDDAATQGHLDVPGPGQFVLSHEISMRNQTIYLDPPLEFARSSWLAQLHDWLGIVCNLQKIQASRYEITVQDEPKSEGSNYFWELPRLCSRKLELAYECVETRLEEVNQYIEKWLQFQSLWDLQNEQVYSSLGDDLSLWLQLLQDIRKTRSTFDTSDTRKVFGNISIDYEQAQVKVNAKYDLWQHEILVKFASRLGNRINEVYAEFQQTRKDLENSSLEASSTAQAVAFITAVQTAKRKTHAWSPEVETFRQGQTALSRQRFHFPTDWLFVESVDHEWAALNEILERKSKLVLDQTDALRAKVSAEDNVLSQRIVEIFEQWKVDRPTSGAIPPKEAINILASFGSKLAKLNGEHEMVTRAKEALELPSRPESGLSTLVEEVQDLQSVWANLSTIWSGLDELRETLWTSVQPRKIRQGLEVLVNTSKDMPSRMRQYEAFEYVQKVILQLIKVNPILSDLRSEAIRERHWLRIFKSLKPSERYSQLSMTLGQVWDLQLGPSESVIRDIIAQAQGEMALEEYLKQVRETWQNYNLDLVNYQNKCRLIRGWDDLFAKCSDNLNSLQAMRHSPYYKQFEEDASSWEERLNKIHVLFDVWIDVQRQWIYLEGVFTGNADIKHLLPTESARFQNINSEFYAVMKKVHKSPLVLEVLTISGVQKSLERLLDLLSKIQKALGEYLERERMSFPRFYFVGDEDLLEIIGNSNNTARIAKHLGKMFAGISGLIMGEDGIIAGFHSKEAEEVHLKREISLAKTPKINEWLAALEQNMQHTLAELASEAVNSFTIVAQGEEVDGSLFHQYFTTFPAQIVVLGAQCWWTAAIQGVFNGDGRSLQDIHAFHVAFLQHLASLVVGELDALSRKKCESLVTEFVYQRDVIEKLIKNKVDSSNHYLWLLQMRYIHNPNADVLERVQVKMANASLNYGFEYLGVMDRLVRTPLTDRCFLTLTQAMCQRLGGSPYGPAGTGKTETVKALGSQLGRFTLVFCCDDTFDFQAMGRIFLGICQVGAWGCFDEFNRLEERILSAVSQQVQNIQIGLRKSTLGKEAQIELVGRQLQVNTNTGIFITMNPGYAGRSNLPDNLKKLFRSVAMSKPDKELIAEVTLYSQGFNEAKGISRQIVPFFDACSKKLSAQAHYDFGLRALKSVLISSGGLKRANLLEHGQQQSGAELVEPQIIIQSIRETVAPKLIETDVALMKKIEAEVFPGIEYVPANLSSLDKALRDVANERKMVVTDTWLTKALQLFKIQELHHGVMMVGGCGSGKSVIWTTLLQALQQVEGIEGVQYIIDPKVMSKEALYGNLDSTTREWTDGLFTSILRKIIDNLRGESAKRHWIVFDGDVDPEWVENLNSVLDDNKLLTLPNGERLVLPPNVRILFEVETLKHATLATVSRCGMVWFSDDIVRPSMIVDNYLGKLRSTPFEDLEEDTMSPAEIASKALAVQTQVAAFFQTQLATGTFLQDALNKASELNHIMTFTETRALTTFFSMLNKTCRLVLEYDLQHTDFPLLPEQIESFVSKKVLLAIVWSFAGDCSLKERQTFGQQISGMTTMSLPEGGEDTSILDFEVSLPNATWTPWQSHVPSIEINTHSVTQTDIVIPTLDTVRHEDVLYTWLAEHRPLILCGPPGSGKTMTLFSALRKLPNMEVVGLNFSSATTPDLLLKSFEQHCEYKKTLNGVVLSPTQIGRWLVIFCDEINLPAQDKYGTQRVIAFLRQMVEYNGFWRTSDKSWITLDRIQFVGACNPPTDAGRVPLGLRFLRHAPLVMVDYPGQQSLLQIYGAFNSAVLKIIQPLRGHAEALTQAMVQMYLESQKRFTPQIQPHYVYSPRELTRWVRGLYEAIKPLDSLDLEGLVRIWAHEAMRLFQDRLIEEEERLWSLQAIHRIALEQFPTVNAERALGGPILFSNWLSKNYVPVDRNQLREYVQARLKTFCEEEVDVPLVLYDDALDHVLRIDRVFRQPQGHLILIGVSGSGKTTLSRFVAWMNGLKVFQIKIHGKYSAEDFDDDLRDILRRSGCKGEKICFIMDESNVLDSAFLEKMNTLLANAEVPGLFEGDEFASLMTACKEGAQRQGLLLDSQDELYKWFTQQIVKNLHVVFTMNPPEDGLSSKAATSPALFNRCVLNWFGDWSDQTLFQVGLELTHSVDLDREDYKAPDSIQVAYRDLNLPPTHREAVVNAMVYMHHSLHQVNRRLQKQQNKVTFLTPRHFLDFVAQYSRLYDEKRDDLEEQQRHLNVGLDKLRDTVEKVRELRRSLAGKKSQLEQKDIEANEKLQRMVSDQQEAEQRKATSLEIQVALDKQEKEVAERKDVVLQDLAKAEPAVLEAQKSVSNIKRQHLTELRSMASPPAGVKLALESVCTLLGHKVENWKAIQGIVRRDDFIASIVNYDNEKQMTKAHRIKMRNDYLSLEEFTYEKVNRASKACGPLVQWVQAQVNYSEILDRVGPLRDEVSQLEEQALQTKAEAQAIQNNIRELEDSISTYKSEYAALISETQAIKAEMTRVQSKVDRSLHLLDSLASERKRWEEGSKTFQTQIATIVGDVLAAAAFITYGGLYDQQYRKTMIDDWLHHLSSAGISFKQHNAMIDYLSTADERLQWQASGLPVDDLCTENAIILKRFNRYPLIIDPSGRIPDYLQNQSKEQRLTITSFLDTGFIKQVESALRFGNTILIQDAEYLDPVLNHVLNREYQKTGGRILIQLGRQEIDFSPSFKLFLLTRDPSASFAPDICSRTSFVNFTVTQNSLQTQSLNDVLKSERPDVDERRTNLIKMQGDFRIHLRRLEKSLLQALNQSRGNILDDDAVIETLETLKNEVAVVTAKVAETEGVMTEVDRITQDYQVIAQSCSAIFAVLEQLRHINHFYQFSLQYFINIFQAVLKTARNSSARESHKNRVDAIVQSLFTFTFRRTSLTVLQKDRMTLALLLAQASPYKMDKTLFDLLRDDDIPFNDISMKPGTQKDSLSALQKLGIFKEGFAKVPASGWDKFATEDAAEDQVPSAILGSTDDIDSHLRSLIVMKRLRADRLVPASQRFVLAVFGSRMFEDAGDLSDLVDQVSATTPVALCCSPGFDASYRVDNLVEKRRVRCMNIAMGSNEGVGSADKAISEAAAIGTWVFIKNVHLALTWLQSLEKRLDSLKPHADFRIFLSMECNPKIPVNLLRSSRVIMCEQPAGVRANIKDSLIPASQRATKAPVERTRLYLLLSILHGVIQERLRYAPTLGWNAFWEFNDADYECAAFVLDTWLDWAASGRSNISPANIPWPMIRALIIETYGGKIDDEEDFARLASLVDSILTPATFDDDYDLIQAIAMDGRPPTPKSSSKKQQQQQQIQQTLHLPSETGWQSFVNWVNRLPEREPPSYLGLPANAEKLLMFEHGKEMVSHVGRIIGILEESEQVMAEAAE